MDTIEANILTEETARLLDRLAGHSQMAYDYSLIGSRSGCNSDRYIEDEDAAYELAAKIRELLREREGVRVHQCYSFALVARFWAFCVDFREMYGIL